jgi:hypothetical protein
LQPLDGPLVVANLPATQQIKVPETQHKGGKKFVDNKNLFGHSERGERKGLRVGTHVWIDKEKQRGQRLFCFGQNAL